MEQQPKTHQIHTSDYLSTLRDLVLSGQEVSLPVFGTSMAPFLVSGRDCIFFSAPNTPLKSGDMVFYRRETGDYVMHRIFRITPEGFYLLGDAQTHVEGPLKEAQIFARVTRIERKGILQSDGFWWRFFRGPWLVLRPLRPGILRCYGFLRRTKKR